MTTELLNTCCVCGAPCRLRHCSASCVGKSRLGQKYSLETRERIAAGNRGKKFTDERRKNISEARIKRLTEDELKKLQELWALRGLNPKMITKCAGVSNRVYERAVTEHCKVEQVKYMPADLEPDELKLLVELASQSVYEADIAKRLGRGRKQVHDCIKRMGYVPVTKNPNRWLMTTSKIEQTVADGLRALGLELTQQFCVKNFVFDIHVVNTNILVEVHGDYWHCNPKVYPQGPINACQRNMMKRDFCKRDVAKKLGYRRLIVWEQDARLNLKKTLEDLKGWIDRHANEGTVRDAGTPVRDADAQ